MLVFIAIGGVIVQQLWNWLLPPLFGWRDISFWQAVGMLLLCRILFGGRGFSRSHVRRRISDRMAARWGAISAEDRERMRERMCGQPGFGAPNT